MSHIKHFLIFLCALLITTCAAATEFKTFTKKLNDSLLWSTYRSNCYFGMRPRNVDKAPLITGLMWYTSSFPKKEIDTVNIEPYILQHMRHFVDQHENLDKFSWELYDPRLGGKEVIIDSENNVNLTLSFAKTDDGANWGVHVHGEPLDPTKSQTLSLVFYADQGGDNSALIRNPYFQDSIVLEGESEELGPYQMKIESITGNFHKVGSRYPSVDMSRPLHESITVPLDHAWQAKNIYQTLLMDSIKERLIKMETEISDLDLPALQTILNVHNFQPGNYHLVQLVYDMDTSFDFYITYNAGGSSQKIDNGFQLKSLIKRKLDIIENKFKSKVPMLSTIDEQKKTFARETFFNLLGGLSYFHGKQLVDRKTDLDEGTLENSVNLQQAEEEGPFSLFTLVPSRAFFPRGFYWDEGFHILQLIDYDFDLSLEILKSWFSLIDNDGWIAREQILGPESRFKVPEEFRVQSPQIANPPTLLLAFSEILQKAMEYTSDGDFEAVSDLLDAEETEFLKKNKGLLIQYAHDIYPKLLKHYEWFRTTQRGLYEEYEDTFEEAHEDEVYRWLGRTKDLCLPSGFDDYPRAQPPDIAELNLDALCWVGVMNRVMKQISSILNYEEDVAKFSEIEKNIRENLNIVHWSEKYKSFCDVTIDNDSYEPIYVCHDGYVTLLPFALKLLSPDSAALRYIVDVMSDPEKLFGEYGLRSLSKEDEYFSKGEDYWRGKIWLNINYLCLDALQYYFSGQTTQITDQDLMNDAHQLYSKLRKNLIDNTFENWKISGYVYENYDEFSGKGGGAKQFTGWTSLVVNMISKLPESL
ncbi:related to Mannosyl-oligosaccharide glucosidase [Saccharomycodes ludwigii]|uniref:Mannosyl-oligosaccharide glucosidase n=1 Tax=Saccharomycodes ludwigii TaxID=36035 RepID=A0A376BAJ3_9ASCO|nr:hypothetical protein SCDLUD_001520 [Saccharomycodes ludwigii]KAH3901747.1 hypothetical protein SCDLUD_001520 [Saccharomycodes ludwigii]SSD61703.1 related to Mannosyl-oligosaccharide glucosidase [Saccharomycodes ludwigii]